MDIKEELLNTMLENIANELNISTTMLDKAIKSYQEVGKWIGDGLDYKVKISPQGSMNLGTVIRPISDKDDYDIDLVCLLENGGNLSAYKIKNIVGDRLKENATYKEKVIAEGEGRRCWKMQYYEFHMDILPAVPKYPYSYANQSDIRITNKLDDGTYEDKFSNPSGYHDWFESRMKEILLSQKRTYAKNNGLEIENVPTYRMHTPLQQAIQLLKAHRNIMFAGNDNAPISIIITTLSALAYNGEDNIYDALKNIIFHMEDYIQLRNNVYWIPNPVMPEENYADKWAYYPERKDAFFKWMKEIKNDFITKPLQISGIDKEGEFFENIFGKEPVQRAFNKLGQSITEARDNKSLFSEGLNVGISNNPKNKVVPVPKHTFYGR